MFDRAEFWNRLLGAHSATDYAIYGLFFFLGAMIFFYGDVKRSIQSDAHVPSKFNFWFMMKDNIFRFLIVLGTIFLAIRFHKPLLGIDSLNEQNCLFHGMAFDAVFGKVAGHGLKRIPGVKKKRDAVITKLKNGH